jgi:parallel beta-helix repeat protein
MTTYYVSSEIGKSANAGTSADAPLATLQAAANLVKPGDTVQVMNGTYTGELDITTSGTASAPITFEAAPGQTPVINSSGAWNAINIEASYITVKGFTVKGDAANYNLSQATAGYSTGDPNLDGNGIAVNSSSSTPLPNHITIENNTVTNEPGGGIETQGADYVQILNNTVENNAHWSAFGNSGISVNISKNLDNNAGPHIVISGNTSDGNAQLVPTNGSNKITDGEGIILDTNTGYTGGFLVQNNTVYNNGGPGIESFLSNNATISDNTIYGNNTQHTQADSNSTVFINQSNNNTVTGNTTTAPTGGGSSASGGTSSSGGTTGTGTGSSSGGGSVTNPTGGSGTSASGGTTGTGTGSSSGGGSVTDPTGGNGSGTSASGGTTGTGTGSSSGGGSVTDPTGGNGSGTSASGGTTGAGTGTSSGGGSVTDPTGGSGTSSGGTTVGTGASGGATPPKAPAVTVADPSLSVSRGHGVDLGLSVSVPQPGDNVTVNIKGLAGYESITDNLDHTTFSGRNITLTAEQVNSGLTLNTSYRGNGDPSSTLSVTATDHTTNSSSAAQSIVVKDPSSTSATGTSGSGSTGMSGCSHGGSSGQWGGGQHSDISQWFDNHPGFVKALKSLSDALSSNSGANSAAGSSTAQTASAGDRAFAQFSQMMAGDFGNTSHFAQGGSSSVQPQQQTSNLLTRPMH